MLGQRGLVAAITAIVLLIFGAILGTPGQFPVFESQAVFTPDYVFVLVGSVVTSLVLLVKNFSALNKALTTRINNPDDPFNPADLKSLFGSKEFWVYAVAALVGIAQMFGVKIVAEEQQIVIAVGLQALAGVLLNSWGDRPSGARQDVTLVELTPIRSNTDGDN